MDIAPALGSIGGGAPELYASSAARITEAKSLLVERARERRSAMGGRPSVDNAEALPTIPQEEQQQQPAA